MSEVIISGAILRMQHVFSKDLSEDELLEKIEFVVELIKHFPERKKEIEEKFLESCTENNQELMWKCLRDETKRLLNKQ